MKVLLLPSAPSGSQVAHQLQRWSAARVLDPFCIRVADDADLSATRVRDGVPERLGLAEALAEADPDRIRFLAFHAVAADELFDDGFSDAVESFLDRIAREALLGFDERRPVVCGLALAPATVGQRVPASVYRAAWTNFYVAPEDRDRPDGSNRLADGAPERFVVHAAHAAATLAGLWTGGRRDRPDLLGSLATAPAGPLAVGVRVARCYSRSVELGHLADHVAAQVFTAGNGWPRPGVDRFERTRDPEGAIEQLANDYLHAHRTVLAPRPFHPITEDPPSELSLLDALRELATLLWSWARRRSVELIDDLYVVLHNKAADYVEQLAGPGHPRVRRIGLPIDDEDDAVELEQALAGPLEISNGPVRTTWRDLRLIALGIVDGSDLPDAASPTRLERDGRRLLVTQPALIAHDPAGPEPEGLLPLLERVRSRVTDAAARAEATARALGQAAVDRDDDEQSVADELGERVRDDVRRLGGLARRAGLLGIGALAIAATAVVVLGPLVGGAIAVAVAIASALGLAAMARTELARPRLPADPEAQRLLDRLNAELELRQAQGDAKRLARRVRELDLWVAILAELVHRPWTRDPFGRLEVVEPLRPDIVPAACVTAVAPRDDALLERVGSGIRSRVFRPGWLSDVYATVYRLAVEEYAVRFDADPEPADTAADTQEDSESRLSWLLETVRRGDGRRLSENPLRATLLEAIDQRRLDELAPIVAVSSPTAQPLPPLTAWINPPEGIDDVARRCAELLRAGGPGGDDEDDGDGDDTADGERSDPLAGFERAEAVLGAAVVAVEVDRDGHRMRWGIAIGAGATAFDGHEPTPGAPIFDLRGRLVGIHDDTPTTAAPHDDDADGHLPVVAFLEAMNGASPGEPPRHLSPSYWGGYTDANAIVLEDATVPNIDGAIGRIGDLTTGAAFMRPLRVMAHRVETTRPIAPDELAAES